MHLYCLAEFLQVLSSSVEKETIWLLRHARRKYKYPFDDVILISYIQLFVSTFYSY